MKVWRVAHSSIQFMGFPAGPYICAGLPEEIDENMDEMRWCHGNLSHPEPRHDKSLGRIRAEERCGFDSYDALFEWFTGFEDLLTDNGFKVWVYEVPEDKVRVGKYGQALFAQYFAVLEDSHEFKKELVG
ncbi:hypothetical protein ACFWNC_14730 [Streptomyces sp. NPDC058369]|uniref:hypothetical protein n=1 Tax=Streptomyces sp. NPDC058369 TaxID=3346462 RepID=UPI003646BE4C